MKKLHRDDLYGWSSFNPERNIDFHGTAWIREGGNVLVDPVPPSEHDLAHLDELGGVAWVVVTTSDHLRATPEVVRRFGARVAGPRAERADFALRCDRWLGDGEELVDGLESLELEGSKTPGELALRLDGDTLITGDLVRAHRGGELTHLPEAKLADRARAFASIHRLAGLSGIRAVLVGDGWPVFRDGDARLAELARSLEA